MSVDEAMIGASILRREDQRFLTGRGRYSADFQVPGEARAVFVRSAHAHAEVKNIDVSPALALPGVVAAYVGAELRAEGVGVVELDFITRNHDGRPMALPERYALSAGRVRYVGEPLAIVVADSEDAARDAAEAVEVTYEELPAAGDLRTALAPGAVQLWPEAPGNIACETRYGTWSEVERAFAVAAHRVRLELVNNRIAVNPIEPRAAIARFDEMDGRYTLITSHQMPFPLRTALSESLKVPELKVHVISPDVGGAFGVKGPNYPEELALLWAARRCRRPLKWVCERSEAFCSDTQARDRVTVIELALDAEARFLAVRVDDHANLGAFVSSFGAGPPILGQMGLIAGPYRTPLIAGRVRMVFSNTAPIDAYRGPGRAECCHMLERVVDLAARELGISPVEIRRRNMIPAEAMPWKAPTGRLYDSGDFAAVFERALARADWPGFEARRAGARSRGQLRGFGVSYYLDHTGIGPSDMILSRGMKMPTYESAHVRLNREGGVTVVTGTHTHGQGLETALAQIVAARLGVTVEEVEVLHGDTQDIGYGRGTVGARSLLVGGAALDVALTKIVDKGRRIAAHLLECAAADIGFERGRFAVQGTDRGVTLAEVAHAAYFPLRYPLKELEPGLEESGYWDPKVVAFPNGCHACEVEIDMDTGVLSVQCYVSVDDFGNVVNPLLVAGQVHGGIAQGLGQALLEHSIYDPGSGQLLTGSLVDYCLPRADDVPFIAHETYPGHPCTTNPLGVKGCGEAGAIGAPPALVNAVVDALGHLGVRHVDMPVKPQSLWRLMHRRA
ncbi:MAG: carbon monoxide dehydrogenase [Betaproteobacteria bacterium RIFCSPLOWO2_02_FULL_63_19]|nr:MAG: carbon monoxide dehydrogenase [Betaproteobacteria bacterium RIFCSPLOWO2_02_FULL_63_19]